MENCIFCKIGALFMYGSFRKLKKVMDPEQYGGTRIEEDRTSLNKLLDWWTKTPYDHYNGWLSETYDALKKAGRE